MTKPFTSLLLAVLLGGWALAQQAFTIRMAYDDLGQLERLTYPDGSVVTYTYANEVGVADTVTYSWGADSVVFVEAIELDAAALVTAVQTPHSLETVRPGSPPGAEAQIANVSELYELNPAQRERLFTVVATLSQRFKHLLGADKLNIEMLGNQVPQLHVHLIARYRTDIAWPNPIWKTPLEVGDWWTETPERLFAALAT